MGGIDPGIDYRWSRYPHARTMMVGVKINFGANNKKKAVQPIIVEREVIREVPVSKEVVKEGASSLVQKTYVVTFEVNKSEIANPAELDGIPAGATVDVVAYASPEGAAEYNMALSQRRADAVAAYLRAKGVKVDRVEAKGADSEHSNRITIVTVK